MKHLFIVGAQRSGTTYLYQMLDSHPQVAMAQPVRPEPKFFLNEQLVAKGRDYYESNYFRERGEKIHYLGEKSTSYIESIEAAQRIRSFFPDARILMILRDPVLRAYSNYRFSVAHQLEELKFTEALKAEDERLKIAKFTTSVTPFAYCKRGLYIDYIKAYRNVFDDSQLRILILEEFANDLASVQSLYHWLGIDDSFEPESLGQTFNLGAVKQEEQYDSFKRLALGYQRSIVELENYLGRTINVWREYHEQIFSATNL